MPALSTTTLGRALTVSDDTVSLASGTGVTVGMLLWVDAELLTVYRVLTATAFKVQRGASATTAAAHASGATVYLGTPAQFYTDDPQGVPVDTPPVTPWINTDNGKVWTVSGSAWVVSSGPVSATSVAATSYSADGTAGASAGPFTTVSSIRVIDGLVTTLTGT